MNEYILALLANLSFALGSQFFTYYSRKFSPIWMNAFKASIALIFFALFVFLSSGFHSIEMKTFLFFFISGFIGLGIGDIFLLKAFKEIGPGRSLLLFGFNPIVVGTLSFLFLNQNLDINRLFGIIFFIICLFIFSIESFKVNKSWGIAGITFAMIGMLFDASGIIITRLAFDMNNTITAFEGNFHRCVGAISAYMVIRCFVNFHFLENLTLANKKTKFYVFIGALLGTVISLSLYLKAIQIAESLAAITAISITSVIFSATFECIWAKKMPSKYLLMAFVFFLLGMKFVL